MTREDIEKCFSYHAAGAAMKYYEQEPLGEIEGVDVGNAFEAGAEWAQEFMIKRACEWLISSFDQLHNEYGRKLEFGNQDVFIEAFKKAMEK